MSMNITKLREDLKTTAAEISALKKLLRASGQPQVTGMTHWELARLKKRATLLCALRAHARGRLHLPGKMDAAAQAVFVAGVFEQYMLPEEAQAA